MNVLLVEDDAQLAHVISRALFERGHVVKTVGTGARAEEVVHGARIDVAVLDWVLPDLEGIDVLKHWRDSGENFPVILLTGKSETEAKVVALRAGADDYLTKPFEFEELLARLEALFRRVPADRAFKVGNAVLDPHARTVTAGGVTENLTDRETALLAELGRHLGEPLSREHLIETVWKGEPVNQNVVDIYVGYVRNKLKRLPAPGIGITSVRKVGFRLDLET
ncbi:MAG: response regulator transcription factor [Anaeromyxobacteraceae bacterium]